MSNELHTMPLMVEKLFSSKNVRKLKLDEFGAYMWLLGEAWLEGARLSSDLEDALETLPKGSEDPDVRKRIKKFVIDRFFHPSEDGGHLINDTQLQLYNKIVAELQSRSSHGKTAAKKRWQAQNGMPEQCQSNARAMPEQCQPNAIQNQSQNQSQISSLRSDTNATGADDDGEMTAGVLTPKRPTPPLIAAAERIRAKHPRVTNPIRTDQAILAAFEREVANGSGYENAIALIENKTELYASKTAEWSPADKRFIKASLGWYESACYLEDPASWERRQTAEAPRRETYHEMLARTEREALAKLKAEEVANVS